MLYRRKSGFTLVELLVVISIIALMLGILLPAMNKAKKSALKTLCAANFHQLGLINQQYASEWGQWLPRFVADADRDKRIGEQINSVVPYLMPTDLYDYLKDTYTMEAKFWICPSLVSNHGKKGFLPDDLNRDELKLHGDGGRYYVGLVHLVGLVNMRLGRPSTVEESARYPNDKDAGKKIIEADLNIKWNREWEHEATTVAHLGYDGMPTGGNRLYGDLHVEWVKSSVMAYQNEPIKERSRGKFDHWSSGEPRDYFW